MRVLATLLCFTLLAPLTGQRLWSEVKESDIQVRADQEIILLPSEYKMYSLQYDQLLTKLELSPEEELAINIQSDVALDLPMPDGTMKSFLMYDSPSMSPVLAAKFPHIRSYKGIAVNDPFTSVRLDVGANGFHAAIHGPEGIFYIDPYASDDVYHYITYDVKHDQNGLPEGVPACGTAHGEEAYTLPAYKSKGKRASLIPLRKYRIAIACTGEYGAWKGDVDKAMSDINTGLNRMNQVYEKDLSIRYELVDNNDALLHFDAATDPYSNTSSGGAMLGINTFAISSIIGVNAYDLGHVYHRSCDVGGIASLGSHCSENKGAGVTCHYGSDLNFFAVSVTAHEIGHQMNAPHTFNNCSATSSGNGPEPGSGSTIMSYAGLCGGNNVQTVAFDNYHTASLNFIYNHTRLGNDECGVKEDFGNHEPVIELPEEYKNKLYIPEDTEFYLKGYATDEDDDEMTYSWEGMNEGPISPYGAPIADAPHFRVYEPSTEGYERYFPRIGNIFSGSETESEVKPKGVRNLRFAFTVRDVNPMTGGTAVWETVDIISAVTDGKFGLTTPSESGVSTRYSDEMLVEWDVAGTNEAPIFCENLDIYLSTTTSGNFDINDLILLAENTPNDGSEMVILPNVATNNGRLLLRPKNNVFFDLGTINFQIKEPEDPKIFADAFPLNQKLCLPAVATIDINTALYNAEGDLNLAVDGLPDGVVATFDNDVVTAGESATLTVDFSGVDLKERVQIDVIVTNDNAPEFRRPITIDVISDNFSDLTLTGPENGAVGVQGAPTFTWGAAQFAEQYDFELSDSPSFDNILFSQYGISSTEYTINSPLETKQVYYWRVRANNSCGQGKYENFGAFSTAALECETIEANNLPTNISSSGMPVVTSTFNVLTQGTIADVNIKTLKGSHSNNKDLFVFLKSPTEKTVRLFGNICPQSNFHLSLDDESNISVRCPLSGDKFYRPQEPLSIFNGDLTQGVWSLIIEDRKVGNGGQLEEVVLELCSNVTVNNPVIETLSKVKSPVNTTTFIRSWNATVTDEDNTSEELTYNMISAPTQGNLLNRGSVMAPGDTFTQEDINQSKIAYQSNENEGIYYASFTTTDGTGGFVGVFDLEIEVNDEFSTSTVDISDDVKLYPNPAQSSIIVSTNNTTFDQGQIYDVNGRLLQSINTVRDGEVLDLSSLANGIYILKLNSDSTSSTTKFVIQK